MKHPNYLILFSMLLVVALSACGAPALPTPPDVSSLPIPSSMTYEPNEANQTGIYLDPGQTRFIRVEEGDTYVLFFAGKNAESKYIAYYSTWDLLLSRWPDWEPVEIVEDGSAVINGLLDMTGKTRPQCMLYVVCLTEDYQILVEFEGGVLK